MIIIKNVLFPIINNKQYQVRNLIILSSHLEEDCLGQWDPITNPDVYKEKWFHGKISRDEVGRHFYKLI